MKAINLITLVLVIIGGINWGLVGAFQFDLVAALFGGQGAALSRLVYILVGLSALWQIYPLVVGAQTTEAHAQRGGHSTASTHAGTGTHTGTHTGTTAPPPQTTSTTPGDGRGPGAGPGPGVR